MDYELIENGNVNLGKKAPEFEAITTYGKINLNDYKGKWLVFFPILETLPPYVQQK